MQPKTKIYIDKDTLEIIAQDSSISDNYYRKIIEIFRRHADLYLDMNDEEYRREELIREIERRVEQMTLRQLEALQYELETKDYSADDAG